MGDGFRMSFSRRKTIPTPALPLKGRETVHIHPPLAMQQRCLQRLHHARLLGGANPHAILHHIEHGRAVALLLRMHARIALRRQKRFYLCFFEVLRHGYGKRNRHTRIVGLRRTQFQININRIRRIALHRSAATLTVQHGETCEHELQVIVHLGHRADGRARCAYRIGLVNCNRGRNALNAIHLRFVHAIKKLARVG